MYSNVKNWHKCYAGKCWSLLSQGRDYLTWRLGLAQILEPFFLFTLISDEMMLYGEIASRLDFTIFSLFHLICRPLSPLSYAPVLSFSVSEWRHRKTSSTAEKTFEKTLRKVGKHFKEHFSWPLRKEKWTNDWCLSRDMCYVCEV